MKNEKNDNAIDSADCRWFLLIAESQARLPAHFDSNLLLLTWLHSHLDIFISQSQTDENN